MKTRIFTRPFPPSKQPAAGMALVIVLGMTFLITVIIIGFLFTAGTQRSATASFQNTVGARQLADTAVNLVQAQINDATMQGNATAWASQPGALRVYNASGALERIYRLYSSVSLTGATPQELAADLPPKDWASRQAVWVDINEPGSFLDSSGSSQRTFPILDPRDPAALGSPLTMPGFALNAPPGATDVQPAPMPVRWLYVLQDGKIVSPTSGSDADTVTIEGASKTNPIVGRIAFWTDDETCKVNLNTAGADGIASGTTGALNASDIADRTFWDTPRFYAADEVTLGKYQPAGGEFQRYPGHPATVALRPILSALGISTSDTEAFYNLLPRYDFGGSQSATTAAREPISLKSGRLYPAPGELLYTKDGQSQGPTRQQAEASRFFLTTCSRAPELTLFGTPRIAVWPVHADADPASKRRTAIDNLIAFCATVNGNPYHFTREDMWSPTHDITLPRNVELLKYLDRLTSTAIPGFGGNFDGKYPLDRRQILTEMFDYVRSTNIMDSSTAATSTNSTVTTSATSSVLQFSNPAPKSDVEGGQGQVAPSTLSATRTPSLPWGTQGFGRFERISEATLLFIGMGKGAASGSAITVSPYQIIPDDQTDGISKTNAYGTYWGYGGIDGNGTPPANTTAVQAFFLLSFFDSNNGWCGMNPGFTIVVNGLDQLTLNGAPMGMKSPRTIYVGYPDAKLDAVLDTRRYGGVFDIRNLIANRRNGTQPVQFPFFSYIVPVPDTGTSPVMTLGSASLTVSVYSGYPNNYKTASPDAPDPDRLVQTYTLSFPQADLPVPKVDTTGTSDPAPARQFGSAQSGTSRMDRTALQYAQTTYTTLIDANYDTVFSLVPDKAWADYRQLALENVPAAAFVPHPNRALGSPIAHGLMSGLSKSLTPAAVESTLPSPSFGKLVDTDYYRSGFNGMRLVPSIPATAGQAGVKSGASSVVPGDWDNGMGCYPDGAYLNRADEGNLVGMYGSAGHDTPYFTDTNVVVTTGSTFFSPNREMPSAGMFGSLPTGVKSGNPWQTLLFRPGLAGHKGAEDPKDHLLTDLFWMPVAEPYAISEPFSTAGKVNLNYEIVPFSYITRNTALQAVLASQKIAKVPKSLSYRYKDSATGLKTDARLALNLSEANGTLRQFHEKFAKGEIFKSASEICDIFLVPEGCEWTDDTSARTAWYGDDFAMVGDNTRERPYAYLLPRVTTKSNVFTVYTRVQMLKNPLPPDQQNQWNERRCKIVGEYRGATTLERYIDTNDKTLPDSATAASAPNLETFYRWRVLHAVRFAQ